MAASRNSIIAANSRQVVGKSPITSGTSMYYRRLTSKYGVENRAYGNWLVFMALGSAGANSQAFDADRNAWKAGYTSRIRAADNNPSPELKQGDQIKDTSNTIWNVEGVLSSGPGTVAYSVKRDRSLMADADRKGGA